tara:strand:- start:142 stop:390 length:249 start_codon:yes stop_codon:yes gene_type:complete
MAKSREVFEKIGKILEQSILNYKDLSNEILAMFKSKRDDFIFKMKITGKEETDILKKRLDLVEKKIKNLENKKNKTKSVKKS